MSKSKRKGSAYERKTLDYINANINRDEDAVAAAEGQIWAEVPELWKPDGGMHPWGDLFGWDDWTIECKNDRGISLGEAMNETIAEQCLSGTSYHLMIQNRRASPQRRNYVVMELGQLIDLINHGRLII